MHIRKKGKKGALALKLDVSKLGFPEVWVDRDMSCVFTPSFSV